jgi:hypothetical protein
MLIRFKLQAKKVSEREPLDRSNGTEIILQAVLDSRARAGGPTAHFRASGIEVVLRHPRPE